MSLSHAQITVSDPIQGNKVIAVYAYTRDLDAAAEKIAHDIIQGEYGEIAEGRDLAVWATDIAYENYGNDCYAQAIKDFAADNDLTTDDTYRFEYELYTAAPKEI